MRNKELTVIRVSLDNFIKGTETAAKELLRKYVNNTELDRILKLYSGMGKGFSLTLTIPRSYLAKGICKTVDNIKESNPTSGYTEELVTASVLKTIHILVINLLMGIVILSDTEFNFIRLRVLERGIMDLVRTSLMSTVRIACEDDFNKTYGNPPEGPQ